VPSGNSRYLVLRSKRDSQRGIESERPGARAKMDGRRTRSHKKTDKEKRLQRIPKASLFAPCLREHGAALPPGSKHLARAGGFWVDYLLGRFTVKLMTVRRSGQLAAPTPGTTGEGEIGVTGFALASFCARHSAPAILRPSFCARHFLLRHHLWHGPRLARISPAPLRIVR
jgi:hypothetical protein